MFDIEKNKKRALFFGQLLNSWGIGNKKAKVGEMFFNYAESQLKAVFVSYEIPFSELYNGKLKTRKGFTMVGIYGEGMREPLSIGFSVCSDKDEWNINRGALNAFVDAINTLSYYDKKECIDSVWGSILKNADKYMKESII